MRGARVLLVITGKGQHVKYDTFNRSQSGIIRASIHDWVKKAPLDELVLRLVPAQSRHGGGGAFYVYLRRKRAKS